MFRNKQLDYSYRKYRYHILPVIKFIIMKKLRIKKMPEFNSSSIEKICDKILSIFYNNNEMISFTKEALQIIEKVIVKSDDPQRMKKLSTTVDFLKKEVFK